jgi:transposase
LSAALTGGQRYESTHLEAVLNGILVARIGPDRPRARSDRVLADKGYSYPPRRRALRRRGIRSTTPTRSDQRRRRFDRTVYRRRNVVERCVGPLKQCRAIATRYEKRAVTGRAMVVIASLLIWIDI